MLTVEYKYYGAEDDMMVKFPAKYEVCDRCQGKGMHTNPSIDGNGLSSEDFDEDPDFREDYFSGVYDVVCYTCEGKRVVLEVCESAFTADDKVMYALLVEQWEDEAASRREQEAERRMGA